MVCHISIESWTNFYEHFYAYFNAWKIHLVTVASLSGIIQEIKETLQAYIIYVSCVGGGGSRRSPKVFDLTEWLLV